jgi:hypothetical protein
MIMRKLLGTYPGDALTNKLRDNSAPRNTEQIHRYIEDGIQYSVLDIDKNGSISPLNDGILLLSQLFGAKEFSRELFSQNSPYLQADNSDAKIFGYIQVFKEPISI